MKKIVNFICLAFLLFTAVLPASAATFEANDEYYLPEEDVVEGNLYSAGSMSIVGGEITGDLFTAGGNVTVNGKIGKDAAVAGGTVIINANIGEDLRTAAGNLTIDGEIGGEILAVGGYVIVSADTEKDAVINGGRVVITGNFKNNLIVNGGEVLIKGKVDGHTKINADSKLTIAENAVIGGILDYSSPTEAEIKDGAEIKGEIKYTALKKPTQKEFARDMREFFAGIFTLKLLTSLIFGAVLFALFGKFIEKLAKESKQKFGINLLKGLAAVIILPIAALILLITILGAPLSAITGLAFAVLLLLSKPLAGIILGGLVFMLFQNSKTPVINWWSVIIGILLMNIIILIPIIGWVAYFVFFLAAFGTLAVNLYQGVLKLR